MLLDLAKCNFAACSDLLSSILEIKLIVRSDKMVTLTHFASFWSAHFTLKFLMAKGAPSSSRWQFVQAMARFNPR